jgi:hypothetical protein
LLNRIKVEFYHLSETKVLFEMDFESEKATKLQDFQEVFQNVSTQNKIISVAHVWLTD